MNSSVGVNKTVYAEVSVVRMVAEVTAVCEGRIAVLVANSNGVVDEFPYAAAEEIVVRFDNFPVVSESPGPLPIAWLYSQRKSGSSLSGALQ